MESGGGSGSKDSLHGLQFGKKIYFEDVGHGGSASKPSPVPPGPAKKGKGVGQGGGGQQHPPRCQVEGCMEDLTNAKSYYCRHKVCGVHSKSPKVVVAGMEQRFCQQCSRFHQLHEFDQGKRSCRRRLAGHNERRRKPPPAPFPSPYGHLSPPFHGNGGRFGGFVVDFSYPRPQTNERDAWLAARPNDPTSAIPWSGETSRVPAQVVYHNYCQASTGESIYDHELQPSNCLGASDTNCALSLLSTQPWGATATSSRAVMISGNNYNSIPMTQPTATPGVVGYSWSSKANETGNGTHDIPPGMGLGMEGGTGGDRFSGELELALQGRRGCGPSNNDLQWSL